MIPCRSIDPEAWFEGPHYNPELAITACCRCPIIEPCLKLAMRTEALSNYRFGIFGGLTAEQRNRLAAADKRNQVAA